jgi:hypothetical protein
MSTIDNGGPAFAAGAVFQEGISARDYFAAKAMQAFVTGLLSDGEPVIKSDDKDIARRAYEIADAMLAVRKEAA